MIETIQSFTKNLKPRNLGLYITDNQQLTENCLNYTIVCLKTTGRIITCGQTSGIAMANYRIRLSGVIAKKTSAQRNAASGRPYLPDDGQNL